MRLHVLAPIALLLAAAPVLAQDVITPGVPNAWQFGGNPESYEVGTAQLQRMTPGTQVAYIKAGPNADCGTYAALFQSVSAEKYRGKRVRLSARLRSDDLVRFHSRSRAHFNLFLFAQPPGGPAGVARANTYQRPVDGPFDWWRAAATLAVPADAEQIVFGFRLSGPLSTGWVDQVAFEIVGDVDPAAGSRARPSTTRIDYIDTSFRGERCAARREFLTARGLRGKDERELLTAARRAASPNVQLALSRQDGGEDAR